MFQNYTDDAIQTQALTWIQEIFESKSTSKLDRSLAQIYLYSSTPAISEFTPMFILSALGWKSTSAKENLIMVLKMYATLELRLPTEKPI